MGKPHGIIVCSESGIKAAKLAQELASILNFRYFDMGGGSLMPDDRPMNNKNRSFEELIKYLECETDISGAFAISCSNLGSWVSQLEPLLDLCVYIATPAAMRPESPEERGLIEASKGGGIETTVEELPCPAAYIYMKGGFKEAAAEIAERYYIKPGDEWRVSNYEAGTLRKYRYTVVFALYGKVGGKWLYARKKNSSAFETPGGHVEPGEMPLDCAKRELYEETGATKFYLNLAFDYSVHTETEFSYGQVFFADIEALGEIPNISEMAEARLFDTLPDKMAYPMILPSLYSKMQEWLGLGKAEAEYWDVLDENKRLKGRKHKRGTALLDGDYHLVVRAWIMNSKGEFLITRRAFNKIGYPGMWEVPSGSAIEGEGSLAAVLRETKEESGIALLAENGVLFSAYLRGDSFFDVWLFKQDFDLSDVVLQEGETIDARVSSWDEISSMIENGDFIDRSVFSEFDLMKGISF